MIRSHCDALRGAIVVVALLVTTGCSANVKPIVASPSTERDAFPRLSRTTMIANAEKVYSSYLETLALSWTRRDKDLQKNRKYASERVVAADEKNLADLADRGLRLTGKLSLHKFTVQEFQAKQQRLTAYTCIDVSDAHVVNRAGKDVTPPDRSDLQPGLITFGVEGAVVVVEKNGTWAGDSSC